MENKEDIKLLSIISNIKKTKYKLAGLFKRETKERLTHDTKLHVCIKDIKRKGSNFVIGKCPQYLTAKMLVEAPTTSIKKTPYYKFVNQIDYYLFYDPAVPDIKKRYQSFLKLFNSIREQGYQPDKYGYIEVIIGDNGEIKLHEGHNRLAILKALNPEQIIEVKVKERSKVWLDFKKFIFETCQRKKYAYHPILHPDFEKWNFNYDDEERFDVILKTIGNPKGRSIIDIGVQLGYFSFKFARLGAEVTGVDNQKRWVDACERLNQVYSTNINFHHNDFVNVLCHYQNQKWDYGLFLNVFHWFAAQKRGNIEAVKRAMLLLSEKIDNLFFSTGTFEESNIASSKLAELIKQSDIPNWICQNTQYKYSQYLFTDKKGRLLFLFRRR